MQAIDYRNTTWEQLRSRVAGMRERVYCEFKRVGPCTTKELSIRSGISLWVVRPRTCELLQLGFIRVVEDSGQKLAGREAVYEALPADDVQSRFEWMKTQPVQQEMKL